MRLKLCIMFDYTLYSQILQLISYEFKVMREARPNLKYGYVMSVPKMSSTFTIYPTVQPVTPLLIFKYSSKCLISTHKIKAREPR